MTDERRIVVDPITGELVDAETGEVIAEHPIDFRGGQRMVKTEEFLAKAHRGARITYRVHDFGLTTVIDKPSLTKERAEVVYYYRERMRRAAKRLERLQRSTRLYGVSKTLYRCLRALNNVCGLMDLPNDVCERAAYILRRLLEARRQVRKWPRCSDSELVAAAVIIAGRSLGMHMSLKATCEKLGAEAKRVRRLMWIAARLGVATVVAADPRGLIPSLCSQLGLGTEVEALAIRIAGKAVEKGIVSGHNPRAIAAAAVYIAAALMNRRRTQEEIARIAGVSETTVRKLMRILWEGLEVVVEL